ncbi:uncharacterized protein N7483_012910 [Penicillium malachiteum]|uniref:uncharacterized protein n=1 Tax=Penicillium malachiteum TaxID=1324776 RepID=UPI0025492A81|nr:uncharacterized protein N7483_012910 [Penicillium malachiteum]KAJ5715729.1 hypothetical protein N7483_012910 [Penicillium malachiteum]
MQLDSTFGKLYADFETTIVYSSNGKITSLSQPIILPTVYDEDDNTTWRPLPMDITLTAFDYFRLKQRTDKHRRILEVLLKHYGLERQVILEERYTDLYDTSSEDESEPPSGFDRSKLTEIIATNPLSAIRVLGGRLGIDWDELCMLVERRQFETHSVRSKRPAAPRSEDGKRKVQPFPTIAELVPQSPYDNPSFNDSSDKATQLGYDYKGSRSSLDQPKLKDPEGDLLRRMAREGSVHSSPPSHGGRSAVNPPSLNLTEPLTPSQLKL